MANAVHRHLLNDEFWIIPARHELAMLPQECMLANLGLNELYGFLDLVQDGSFKSHILDDVHFSTHLFIGTLISDKTSAGAREELLRVLTE